MFHLLLSLWRHKQLRQVIAARNEAGEVMPELDSWVNHSATLLYWRENMGRDGGHPHLQQSDLPVLLADKWRSSTSDSWSSFLGRALIGAASDGHLPGVKQLLSANANALCRDRDGATPLHRASSVGHAGVVAALLGDEDELDLSRQTVEQTRLIWRTSVRGSILMSPRSNRKNNVVNARDRTGFSPLHCAAATGRVDIVRMILDNGGDCAALNGFRLTPLHMAAGCAAKTSSVCVGLLIEGGSEVTARDDAGRTPLHLAAYAGHADSISALVEAGAVTDARGHITSRTPLHEACARLRVDSVRRLLELGASESVVDGSDETPGDLAEELASLESENSATAVLILQMLENAPQNRMWQRRRLLLLLRSRLTMEKGHAGGVGEPVGQSEADRDGPDQSVVYTLVNLEEDLFRNIMYYI